MKLNFMSNSSQKNLDSQQQRRHLRISETTSVHNKPIFLTMNPKTGKLTKFDLPPTVLDKVTTEEFPSIVKMTNTTHPHNTFYTLEVFKNKIKTTYGRIGTSGSSATYPGDSPAVESSTVQLFKSSGVYHKTRGLLLDKLAKGYTVNSVNGNTDIVKTPIGILVETILDMISIHLYFGIPISETDRYIKDPNPAAVKEKQDIFENLLKL